MEIEDIASQPVLQELARAGLTPRHLLARYPHVLARIVAAWDSAEGMDATVRGLMLADPRRKQGFPQEVMSEIFAIARYHEACCPRPATSPLDIWNRAQELRRERGRIAAA
jgi:hypothetical protein